MMKKYIIFQFLLIPLISIAQLQLSLHSSIDTALQNSFDIRIERNNVEISKINNSFGVAGGLPSLNASAGGDKYQYNISQETGTDSVKDEYKINGTSLNADISASMVLYNGSKIIAAKKRLGLLQKQSEIILNRQIQNTVAGVMIKYYDIVRQESYLKIIRNTLDVSREKMKIIQEKDNVGMASAVDILQAKTDVRLAEQDLKLQESIVAMAKTDLLLVIDAKSLIGFEVDGNISVDSSLTLDMILNNLNNNPGYLESEQHVMISEQSLKEISAQRYPSVRVNAAYTISRSDNDAGSVLMNRNYGPSAGLSLQVPIFNGFIYKSQKSVAELNLSNSKLQKENLLNSLYFQAFNLYQSYSTAIHQIVSQQKNYEMSKQLVDLVMQNFQVNQATILDVKAAQTSLENASNLLINLKYTSKIAEIELKELIYKLEY